MSMTIQGHVHGRRRARLWTLPCFLQACPRPSATLSSTAAADEPPGETFTARCYCHVINFNYSHFSHNSRDRLADLVAEHLDHLHYLNDILCLNIDALNEVLTDHLLNRLFIPLYVYSLTKRKKFSALTVSITYFYGVVIISFGEM